mmetsp:Transcript_52408/g.78297  ORF Transcript_52408/g.78297 Transcript_52408/m.78297 type:complete len:239 (-) Transcript_52408:771-1487(-)
MSLIQINIGTIFLRDTNDIAQITIFSLHTINSFDNDQNSIPWTTCSRTSHNNRFFENLFQLFGIIVAKGPNGSTRSASAIDNACMIQTVRDNQITSCNESGDGSSVGIKAHVETHGIFLFEKVTDGTFDLTMEGGGPKFCSGSRGTNRKVREGGQDLRLTGNVPIIGKAQVVVTTKIETIACDNFLRVLLVVSRNNLYIMRTGRVLVHLLFIFQIVQTSQQFHRLVAIRTDPFQYLDS